MNLKNKLDKIPSIYYVNLDNRVDRREYMENQFDYWEIDNFNRVSATKYLASEFDDWKHLISNKKYYQIPNKNAVAAFLSHMKMIKKWLEETNEKYFIMMEDDYDLSLIKYWNFDWTFLMNQIPFDWDCLQLGFESFDYINFFLHPKRHFTYFGACMINRHYAEKLIKLYMDGEKVIIDNETNDVHHLEKGHGIGDVDYSICHNGKTYCIPLIPQNPNIKSHENFIERRNWGHVFKTYDLYYDWWINDHHKFSLRDFFTYGKINDGAMTKEFNNVGMKIAY